MNFIIMLQCIAADGIKDRAIYEDGTAVMLSSVFVMIEAVILFMIQRDAFSASLFFQEYTKKEALPKKRFLKMVLCLFVG